MRSQNEAGESLKNVVLVMHSSNLLVPPPSAQAGGTDTRTAEQKNLWKASAERIERILPGFLEESVVGPSQSQSRSHGQGQSQGQGQAGVQAGRKSGEARTSVDA